MASPTMTTLPSDLLLEIVQRTDAATLVRCAAACKVLRRHILDPFFIRHVTQHRGIVPSRLLVYLNTHKVSPHHQPLISLVHPATLAAMSLCDNHLAPFVSRTVTADNIPRQYVPLTSRGGLVLLRRSLDFRMDSRYNLCVYNPMTGERTFLADPPDVCTDYGPPWNNSFVMLTAADGISCSSFLLLVADLRSYNGHTIRIRTATSGGVGWGPAVNDQTSVGLTLSLVLEKKDAIVLPGGIINWLVQYCYGILQYDVLTTKAGTLKLPPITRNNADRRNLELGMSPGRRLRLLVADRFKISMWLQVSPKDGGWQPEAVIDTEEKLQLLVPNIQAMINPNYVSIEFMYSGERSGVVLLQVNSLLVILDVETKEMHHQDYSDNSSLLEIDLLSRLQTMKIFSYS